LSIALARRQVARQQGGRYNLIVRLRELHCWRLSIAEAKALQLRLAGEVSPAGEVVAPRFVAGVDVASRRGCGVGVAAAVVLQYPELVPMETQVVVGPLGFPYVPGLLSFREAPLILAACEALATIPDLVIVDGQGVAHPRRIGLASHLGLFLDRPTIGCAKSRLVGEHGAPADEAGSHAWLADGGETIGVALRTKAGTKPVYVSVGHRVDLPTAVRWVLECCRGYRLPEPVRLAHQAAGSRLRQEMSAATGSCAD
jgi:deoxyribonuclease V